MPNPPAAAGTSGTDNPMEPSIQIPRRERLAMERRLREWFATPEGQGKPMDPLHFTAFLQHGEDEGGSNPLPVKARLVVFHNRSTGGHKARWTIKADPPVAGVAPRTETWVSSPSGEVLEYRTVDPGGRAGLRPLATPTPLKSNPKSRNKNQPS